MLCLQVSNLEAEESHDKSQCFQETKVTEAKLPEEMKNVEDYPHTFWLAAEKDGYSGVGNHLHYNVEWVCVTLNV